MIKKIENIKDYSDRKINEIIDWINKHDNDKHFQSNKKPTERTK